MIVRKTVRLTIQGHGSYTVTESRFPLVRLAVLVLAHRLRHALQGEGWID